MASIPSISSAEDTNTLQTIERLKEKHHGQLMMAFAWAWVHPRSDTFHVDRECFRQIIQGYDIGMLEVMDTYLEGAMGPNEERTLEIAERRKLVQSYIDGSWASYTKNGFSCFANQEVRILIQRLSREQLQRGLRHVLNNPYLIRDVNWGEWASRIEMIQLMIERHPVHVSAGEVVSLVRGKVHHRLTKRKKDENE